MKDSEGMELLQRITAFRYDNNGNELRRSVEYISLFNKANPKAYEAAVYGEETTEPIHAVVDQTVSKYDGFNRLVRTELIKATARTVVEYAYNGDDLRIKKTVRRSDKGNAAEATSYLYDRQHVILETRGNESISYARGINYIGRVDNAGTLSYFLYNGHGDVVQTVSEAGEIENQYDYDIFGNPTLTVENYLNSIRYAGEFYDSETGLYYLRARYYDPYIGRFISEDSYWGEDSNPLSLNLYTYCENDPIQYVDPTGHWGGAAGERDDTQLSREDQKKIKDLTDKYFSTNDKGERDKIHEAAEKIRKDAYEKGTTSKDNSDSFGRAANEKIKEDREEKGRSYMSDKEWRELSTEHERRSGGVSERNEHKTIEAEIKTIREREEKSSDYIIGSRGYAEDVDKIKKDSGSLAAMKFVMEDEKANSSEFYRIKYDKDERKFNSFIDKVNELVSDIQPYTQEMKTIKNGKGTVAVPGKKNFDVFEEIHYFRNILNKVPNTLEKIYAINADPNTPSGRTWKLLPYYQAAFHMYGDNGEFNVKFVTEDGHFEAVYDNEGKLVTSPKNMGTYNYFGPNNAQKHIEYDVEPYYALGNTVAIEGKGEREELIGAGLNIKKYLGNDRAKEKFMEVESKSAIPVKPVNLQGIRQFDMFSNGLPSL